MNSPGAGYKGTRGARPHPAWGWFVLLLGALPIGVASGLFAGADTGLNAPRWVLGLTGFVFVIGGCMILGQPGGRRNAYLAAAMLGCFAAIAAWIALFGNAEHFTGGIPLVSAEANTTLARWLFGGGALVTALLSVFAVRRASNDPRA
jgi:hypothetical protein